MGFSRRPTWEKDPSKTMTPFVFSRMMPLSISPVGRLPALPGLSLRSFSLSPLGIVDGSYEIGSKSGGDADFFGAVDIGTDFVVAGDKVVVIDVDAPDGHVVAQAGRRDDPMPLGGAVPPGLGMGERFRGPVELDIGVEHEIGDFGLRLLAADIQFLHDFEDDTGCVLTGVFGKLTGQFLLGRIGDDQEAFRRLEGQKFPKNGVENCGIEFHVHFLRFVRRYVVILLDRSMKRH